MPKRTREETEREEATRYLDLEADVADEEEEDEEMEGEGESCYRYKTDIY